MTPVELVLSRLPGYRSDGPGWAARCPAHEDSTPSLTIGIGDDERALLCCHAGCTTEAIVTALGLAMSDLFPPKARDDRPRIVATYAYQDEAGELLYEVVRMSPKSFRQRRPNPSGGWVWNMTGVNRVLYRLPFVIAAVRTGSTVFVVEGEKDADAITKAGGIATCNPGGAGKWDKVPGAVTVLKGATVIIVADDDKPGHAHAQQVAKSLTEHAASVRIVKAAKGKDAFDHLAAGYTLADFVHVPDQHAANAPDHRDRGAAGNEVPSPNNPMAVARYIVDDHHRHEDGLTLTFWRGDFYRWTGSAWLAVEGDAVRADLYHALEHAVYLGKDDLEPWAPNRRKIADVTDALQAVTFIDVEPPAWITTSADAPAAARVVAVGNGLLHVPTRRLIPHTPSFFNFVSCPFDFDPDAPVPERWLTFLRELWPNDPEAIATLQEFFGYVLSGRTDIHKILLLIGPTRAGKGVIARVLRDLVGRGNVAGPTLNSLGQNFGLQPLLGKSLALISDARLGGRDANVVIERLLSISGEDTLTVDVKFKEPWTGKLSTRFLIISNELPRFGDASGAIANRMVILTLGTSWLGRENTRLTDELLTEMAAILNWSLAGLDRVNQTGRISEPTSSRDAATALEDMASPTGAFVRTQCDRGPLFEVNVEVLYLEWQRWCESQGSRATVSSVFGRDLRAVAPGVSVFQPRDAITGKQSNRYRGIQLKPLDERQ